MGLKIVFLLCLLSLTLQMNNIECNVEGCVSCDVPNQCAVCQDNYQMGALASGLSTCLRTDCAENCATCNQENQCLSCLDGFLLAESGACETDQTVKIEQRRLLQGGNFTGNCTIPNCQVCDAGVCLFCNNFYQLVGQGRCMSCNIPDCSFCTSPNVCGACIPGLGKVLSPNGGACVRCNQTRPLLRQCSSCSEADSCGLCNNGLQLYQFMNSGVCIACSILNCVECGLDGANSTKTICLKCATGASVSPLGDRCIQCSFPCASCLPLPGPKNCATCTPPMFFSESNIDGTCIKNSIPGCIAPNTANVSLCSRCGPGFNLAADGSRCNWNCPNNCVQCSSNITCSSCVSGFFVNSSNLCSQCQAKGCAQCTANACTRCIKGFYLMSNECKVCPGFCLDCASATTCLELAESESKVLLTIGGKSVLAVCEGTCITCSNLNPAVCLVCLDGFYLSSGKCLKCGGNCETCATGQRDTCLSCFPNTFLSSSNTCVRCNPSCMTCQDADNTDKCTSCWDGFYLDGTTCSKGCPKNCFTCSNLTTCTQCLSGYTTFRRDSSIICAPCMTSCRTCAEGKPSTCLSCGNGFYLLNVTCVPCSANCAECTAAGCLTCSQGFFMTSQQTCALNCILPCATCSVTDAEKCESCIAGYSFDDVAQRCVEVRTCDGGCIVCPMGYSLSDGLCLACTKENCQSCNVADLGMCFSCKPGFFLNAAGTCDPCPAQCRTCLTGNGCTLCSKGFTVKENAVPTSDGMDCIKCNAPCKTCMNTPDYCTSCVDGFDFFGWKCAQKFRFTFGVVLTVSLSVFEANYMVMIEAFAAALQVADSNAITITSITGGSVDLNGNAAPTGAPGSSEAGSQLASLTALVKSGNIAGMAVGSSTISVDEGTVGDVSTEEAKSNVLAIVLGICIPIAVLIIIGIIVFVIYKKKAAQKVRDFDTEEERKNNGVFNNTNDKIVN